MHLLHHQSNIHTLKVCDFECGKLLRRWPPVFKIELHQIPSRRKTLTTNNIKGFLGHQLKPMWSQTFLSQHADWKLWLEIMIGNYDWKLNTLELWPVCWLKTMVGNYDWKLNTLELWPVETEHILTEKTHTDLCAIESPRLLHPMKFSQVLRQGRNMWIEFTTLPPPKTFLDISRNSILVGYFFSFSPGTDRLPGFQSPF